MVRFDGGWYHCLRNRPSSAPPRRNRRPPLPMGSDCRASASGSRARILGQRDERSQRRQPRSYPDRQGLGGCAGREPGADFRRRLVRRAYARPEPCMHVYGSQLAPILETLLRTGGLDGLRPTAATTSVPSGAPACGRGCAVKARRSAPHRDRRRLRAAARCDDALAIHAAQRRRNRGMSMPTIATPISRRCSTACREWTRVRCSHWLARTTPKTQRVLMLGRPSTRSCPPTTSSGISIRSDLRSERGRPNSERSQGNRSEAASSDQLLGRRPTRGGPRRA